MNGYHIHDFWTIGFVGILLFATLLLGFGITRLSSERSARLFAWILTIGVTVSVERLCKDEPAGIRMLVLIGALLYGMKSVVTVEAQADGMHRLSMLRWFSFAALWPGMRPSVFATSIPKFQRGAWLLIRQGLLHGLIGFLLVIFAWFLWHQGRESVSENVLCVLATFFLLPGLSLILHFGLFNLIAGVWRLFGIDTRPLFRMPFASKSLNDFWGRRWNLAFSEMTALGIYRPLSRNVGRKSAIVCAFFASGLLHELAISVPVLAGFGLPMSYFLLHGGLVLIERSLEQTGHSITNWGGWSHVWVLSWLALPAPILFHKPFLQGTIWPLIGMN